jgi:hypothetical protein
LTTQAALSVEGGERSAATATRRQSAFKFFFRYPIFLLAFGPPQFKPALTGVDTSQAHFDPWNILQVAWLAAIALRAFVRLAKAKPLIIRRPSRTIVKLALLLGMLFTFSIVYSPGRVVSAEYVLLYFLNLACMAEFVVDAQRTPPDWMQCILQLRLVALLLFATVLVTLAVAPALVVNGDSEGGIRLMGGHVASMGIYPEFVAIISAYTFLHRLEARFTSAWMFAAGIAGTLLAKTRGIDISLVAIFILIAVGWARMRRRFAYTFMAFGMVLALVLVAAIAAGGGEAIWRAFNRGDDSSTLFTASGRTGVWKDQILYCLSHPEGMGYVAGVRAFHRKDFSGNLHASLTNIGGTDNAYMEVLTDAGWLALGVYLAILVQVNWVGWRLARTKLMAPAALGHPRRNDAIDCVCLLLLFCMVEGMESSMYVVPLFGAFYLQNILISILLGASASAGIGSRAATLRISAS